MKYHPKPWVKLFREERGAFALLPLAARALAADMLKRADPDGTFFVGDEGLEVVYARRFGATVGDRRMLKQCIPLLFEEGFIERRGGLVAIKNYDVAQRQADASPLRDDSEQRTSDHRDRNEPRTRSKRTANEIETRSDLTAQNPSQQVSTQREEGEKRREEKITDLTRDPEAWSKEPDTGHVPVHRAEGIRRFEARFDALAREALAAVEKIHPRAEAPGASLVEFRSNADEHFGGDVAAAAGAAVSALRDWKLAEYAKVSDPSHIETLRSFFRRGGGAQRRPAVPAGHTDADRRARWRAEVAAQNEALAEIAREKAAARASWENAPPRGVQAQDGEQTQPGASGAVLAVVR